MKTLRAQCFCHRDRISPFGQRFQSVTPTRFAACEKGASFTMQYPNTGGEESGQVAFTGFVQNTHPEGNRIGLIIAS